MPSKIEKELTPEEVVDLLEELQSTEGGTRLKVIQELAAKRGVKISLMSASSFRDGALEPYLSRLHKARENSLRIAEELVGGEESGALGGARLLLAEQMMDLLMGGEVQPKQFGGLAKALMELSRAQQGDDLTKVKLREFQIKEEERKEKKVEMESRKSQLKSKGGLTQETLELIEDAIGLL